jgi:hypothetical protein
LKTAATIFTTMSLYRITSDKLEPVSRTTFAAESLLERKDLQRLLRRDITPIADDLMVIAEEYGEWEDSNRRIDLLCLSKDAGLVVVEIKRTEDGGHMELQAIRYAAMVAAFEALRAQRASIEAVFGGALDWQDLPGRNGCRICTEMPGGWKSPEADWPAIQDQLIDALIRLDAALRKPIQELKA